MFAKLSTWPFKKQYQELPIDEKTCDFNGLVVGRDTKKKSYLRTVWQALVLVATGLVLGAMVVTWNPVHLPLRQTINTEPDDLFHWSFQAFELVLGPSCGIQIASYYEIEEKECSAINSSTKASASSITFQALGPWHLCLYNSTTECGKDTLVGAYGINTTCDQGFNATGFAITEGRNPCPGLLGEVSTGDSFPYSLTVFLQI